MKKIMLAFVVSVLCLAGVVAQENANSYWGPYELEDSRGRICTYYCFKTQEQLENCAGYILKEHFGLEDYRIPSNSRLKAIQFRRPNPGDYHNKDELKQLMLSNGFSYAMHYSDDIFTFRFIYRIFNGNLYWGVWEL